MSMLRLPKNENLDNHNPDPNEIYPHVHSKARTQCGIHLECEDGPEI